MQKNGTSKAKSKRDQVRLYQVNAKAKQPLIDVLPRRYKAGTMPWVRTAQDYLETKAQDAVYDGTTIIEPDMVRQAIRGGLLDSLRIHLNKDGCYECDPYFLFTYKGLRGTSWYQWACEHKDEVNAANLGAQFTGDAPSDKAINKWIGAMGISLVSTKVDASKLVDFKE
ncbi:MAG: hypothetical protein ABFS56_26370 [Pseudomonadota bacterium]